MDRVLSGLLVIGLVAVLAGAGAVSVFNDTEVSEGNRLEAGVLDLKIDFEGYYIKEVDGDPNAGYWELTDLDGEKFFDLTDVKPGDYGEGTVSIHVEGGPAHVWMSIDNLVDNEGGIVEPEAEVDETPEGELSEKIEFLLWEDDGNNTLDEGEELLFVGDLGRVSEDDLYLGSFENSENHYIGVSWELPENVGNEVQSDSVEFDFSFYAEQTRHNPGPIAPSEVSSLSITAESPTEVGRPSPITVMAFDDNGDPVKGADVRLDWVLIDAKDPETHLIGLTGQGDGSYTGSLTTPLAGSYRLIATTPSGIRATEKVRFTPARVEAVEVTSTSPKPTSGWYSSLLRFHFLDGFGNVVPAERVSPRVTTDFGNLGETTPMTALPDDTFKVSLDTKGWGNATVTVRDDISGVSSSEKIRFGPVYYTISYQMGETAVGVSDSEPTDLDFSASGGEQLTLLDLGIYFPPDLGSLGSYTLNVGYDNSIMDVENVFDPDPTDGFGTPEWISGDNKLLIRGSGTSAEPDVDVATVVLGPEGFGKTVLKVNPTGVGDNEGDPVENLPPGVVRENAKVFEKMFVPLKIWIVDNVRSEEEVRRIAEKTENIYNKNAKACRFKYWFVFLTEINHIPQGEWDNKVPTGHVEGNDPNDSWWPEPGADDQRENLVEQNRWEGWINVYWLPDNAFGEFGWYKDNSIFVDNANEGKDNHITVAHELAHYLSGGDVEDPTTATGRAQGADNYCNLMAYDFDKSHGTLTENQAEEIEEWLEDNSENRPESEGGGKIIDP